MSKAVETTGKYAHVQTATCCIGCSARIDSGGVLCDACALHSATAHERKMGALERIEAQLERIAVTLEYMHRKEGR